MLDFNHPMAKHTCDASRAEDAILMAAHRMTIVTRHERVRLCDGCKPALAALRRLGRDHFADRPAIPPSIDALEKSLAVLAAMPLVPEQGPPAEYECPACGATLKRLGKYGFLAPDNPTDIYCSRCLDIIMPSLEVLRSSHTGFGTDDC